MWWRFLLRIFILTGIILIIAYILPGLYVPDFSDALIFAFVVALINSTIAPILIFISFPLTVMTVGLFVLLINVFTFWLASLVSYGVQITSFWGAFWGGIIVLIASTFLNQLFVENPPRKR